LIAAKENILKAADLYGSMHKVKIIEKKVEELIPYVNNPRNNEAAVDFVASSIKEFGFKNPIIIDKENVIVAGHTRLAAAKKLGLESVPCIMADDLTEQQVKAFRLADNKVAEFATWDAEKLGIEMSQFDEIDMSEFGFDMSEFEDDITVEGDDGFELDEEIEAFVQKGQIWKLGEHRVMCGDSTKREDVEKLMDGAVADLCVTDPPYNIDYEGSAGKIINDSWQEDEGFITFLTSAFDNMKEFLKIGGVFYIWYASTESKNFLEAATRSNLEIRQWLVWAKSTFTLGRQDYQWRHEPCLYGWKEGAAHYFINDRTQDTILDDMPDFEKMKKEELVEFIQKIYEYTTIIYEDKPTRSDLHPTMKPISLFARLIKNSSRRSEKVMDLFGGSGTTIIASEQLGRQAFVMEYDEKYASNIIKRWEEFTGRTAELING
jgi:site-specific DNA-methyltransferase (adenine-specific)